MRADTVFREEWQEEGLHDVWRVGTAREDWCEEIRLLRGALPPCVQAAEADAHVDMFTHVRAHTHMAAHMNTATWPLVH